MIGATTAITQDTRVQKKDGTYALKLRITFNREQKYYLTGKYLTKQEWQTLKNGKHRNKKLKELDVFLSTIEAKAVKIIDNMSSFTFPEFQAEFNTKPITKTCVLDALKARYKKLFDENRFSTANSYLNAASSIEKFLKSTKRKKLTFYDITPEWLQSYEDWMTKNDKSITTTGIYLRNLRAIINQAIEKELLPIKNYPFSKNKYQIPAARNIKKALAIQNIKKFVQFVPRTKSASRAKDMWLLVYLCSGVNIKDIVKLQYKNLDDRLISFIRSKSERSSKANLKTITIIRTPEINAIIEKWGNPYIDKDTYVFPILSEGDTPLQKHKKIKQAIKTIDEYTKEIGEELGFPFALTTQVARHSYATVLKRSGTSIEFISESLGHSNLKTTQNYLDSFEDETKEIQQHKLLDF